MPSLIFHLEGITGMLLLWAASASALMLLASSSVKIPFLIRAFNRGSEDCADAPPASAREANTPAPPIAHFPNCPTPIHFARRFIMFALWLFTRPVRLETSCYRIASAMLPLGDKRGA